MSCILAVCTHSAWNTRSINFLFSMETFKFYATNQCDATEKSCIRSSDAPMLSVIWMGGQCTSIMLNVKKHEKNRAVQFPSPTKVTLRGRGVIFTSFRAYAGCNLVAGMGEGFLVFGGILRCTTSARALYLVKCEKTWKNRVVQFPSPTKPHVRFSVVVIGILKNTHGNLS